MSKKKWKNSPALFETLFSNASGLVEAPPVKEG
jgi:hypothetical protein